MTEKERQFRIKLLEAKLDKGMRRLAPGEVVDVARDMMGGRPRRGVGAPHRLGS